MPSLRAYDLSKRYVYGSSSWGGGARWAFFAIFIAVVIVVILGTFRANKKRTARGIEPIYGTRWMTPPSYLQSQHQYNQPQGRDADMPSAYVPAYSARANEYDMGYYDQDGVFHANPNAKASMPQGSGDANIAPPEQTHQRTTSTATDGVPLSSTVPASGGVTFTDEGHQAQRTSEDSFDLYRRPGGVPGTFPSQSMNNGTRESSPEYGPPASPPPDLGSSSRDSALPSFSESPHASSKFVTKEK